MKEEAPKHLENLAASYDGKNTHKMGPIGWEEMRYKPRLEAEVQSSESQNTGQLSGIEALAVDMNKASATLIESRKPEEIAHTAGVQKEPSAAYVDAVKSLTDLVASHPDGVVVLLQLQKGR